MGLWIPVYGYCGGQFDDCPGCPDCEGDMATTNETDTKWDELIKKKRLTRTRWGESKLTTGQRVEVRRSARKSQMDRLAKQRGITLKQIAAQYGVHYTTVAAIRDGTGSYRSMGDVQ